MVIEIKNPFLLPWQFLWGPWRPPRRAGEAKLAVTPMWLLQSCFLFLIFSSWQIYFFSHQKYFFLGKKIYTAPLYFPILKITRCRAGSVRKLKTSAGDLRTARARGGDAVAQAIPPQLLGSWKMRNGFSITKYNEFPFYAVTNCQTLLNGGKIWTRHF